MAATTNSMGYSAYAAETGTRGLAIRRIGVADLGVALRQGWEDFRANPTHLIFLGLIYPVMGLVLGRIASGANAVPLLYPLLAGFALIGPFAAIGLYDMSRSREQGRRATWRDAFDVLRSPRIVPILALGAVLAGIFVAWLLAAMAVLHATMGRVAITSRSDFFHDVMTTSAGWHLILVGGFVGFLFAALVLAISVVSFPLLLDRRVGQTTEAQVLAAVATSVRAVRLNLLPMAAWGLIVAAGMAIGSATLLVGFAVVMPVLGHSTWHLYRKLIA